MNPLIRLLAIVMLLMAANLDNARADTDLDERQVHDLLRTTIIVSDYDRAHELFHGILGLPVDFSIDLDGDTVNELMGQTGRSMRITIFNVNGTTSGRVAVLAYLDDLSPQKPVPGKLDAGAVVIVLETTHIAEIARRVSKAGYRILAGPSVLFPDDKYAIQAQEMMFVGPDGIAINLIQRGVLKDTTQ